MFFRGSLDVKAGSYGNDYKFTGKELDDSTGLYYYGARYYDSGLGRLTSVDPLSQSVGSPDFFEKWRGVRRDAAPNNHKNRKPTGDKRSILQDYLSNPQRLNSYSYVTNNPLKYADPDGESEVHFSLTGGVGLGVSVGFAFSVGAASDGSYGLSFSYNTGGLIGGDASVGVAAGYSTAETWSDTIGDSTYVETGGKLLGVGGDVTFSSSDEDQKGVDVGVGVGPASPYYAGGGVSYSSTIADGNIKDDINNITQAVSTVANKVSDAVKEGAKKIINLFKKE